MKYNEKNTNKSTCKSFLDYFTKITPTTDVDNIEALINGISESTTVKGLENTPVSICDPYKDFMLLNLRDIKTNCAVVSDTAEINICNTKAYDIALLVGVNGLKALNFDYDKIIIFNPKAHQGKTCHRVVMRDENNENEKILCEIYGEIIVVGVDWETDSFRTLTNEDITEIKERITGKRSPF